MANKKEDIEETKKVSTKNKEEENKKEIEKETTDGVEKDYISIEYQGGDNLFILASALDQIAKYASANARKTREKERGKERDRRKIVFRIHVHGLSYVWRTYNDSLTLRRW